MTMVMTSIKKSMTIARVVAAIVSIIGVAADDDGDADDVI